VSWPLRVAPTSFISYGVWTEGDEVDAYARFAGVVESSEERTVELTGGRFIAATVQSLFPTTVCLSSDDHDTPAVGSVIAGTVFMVGSIELPVGPAKPAQRRFSLFRRAG
jgi:hypothetical protein